MVGFWNAVLLNFALNIDYGKRASVTARICIWWTGNPQRSKTFLGNCYIQAFTSYECVCSYLCPWFSHSNFFFFPAFTSHMKTRLDILISFRLYLKKIFSICLTADLLWILVFHFNFFNNITNDFCNSTYCYIVALCINIYICIYILLMAFSFWLL